MQVRVNACKGMTGKTGKAYYAKSQYRDGKGREEMGGEGRGGGSVSASLVQGLTSVRANALLSPQLVKRSTAHDPFDKKSCLGFVSPAKWLRV